MANQQPHPTGSHPLEGALIHCKMLNFCLEPWVPPQHALAACIVASSVVYLVVVFFVFRIVRWALQKMATIAALLVALGLLLGGWYLLVAAINESWNATPQQLVMNPHRFNHTRIIESCKQFVSMHSACYRLFRSPESYHQYAWNAYECFQNAPPLKLVSWITNSLISIVPVPYTDIKK